VIFIKSFFDLIIERGVIGLAAGFLLANLISRVVGSLLGNIVYPALSFLIGPFWTYTMPVGKSNINFGDLITATIEVFVMGFVIYFILKMLSSEEK